MAWTEGPLQLFKKENIYVFFQVWNLYLLYELLQWNLYELLQQEEPIPRSTLQHAYYNENQQQMTEFTGKVPYYFQDVQMIKKKWQHLLRPKSCNNLIGCLEVKGIISNS